MAWYLYIENSRNILYELHDFAVIISKRGVLMELNAKYSYAKNGVVLEGIEYVEIDVPLDASPEELAQLICEEIRKKTGHVGVKYLYEQSMRLQQNYHALNKSYSNLSKVMKNIENHQEIYTSIGETLLWVITTNDWFEKNGENDYLKRRKRSQKGQQILGIRYAFNRFKHNMDSINLHSVGFSTEPIENKEIKWMPVREGNEKFQSQFDNYRMYIQGKIVIESFTDVVEFLREEFQRTIFK